MRIYIQFLLLSILVYSCTPKKKLEVDVSDISVSFDLRRFDVAFYTASKASLPQLKLDYPLFFPSNTPDSIWLGKMKNTDEQALYRETLKVYPDTEDLERQLTSLFAHITYYYPAFKAPNVVTMLSNIDYDYRVVYTDSLLLISLDAYLGEKHPYYEDYPRYIKQTNTKDHIVVDVANAIIEQQFPPQTSRVFLHKMISEGIKWYYLDAYMPQALAHHKMGYSKQKLVWATANEVNVWGYFIENNLLYSTDSQLNARFLDLAPFSKFYKLQDVDSPGQIGKWIGYQIVKSFMKNNDVSLQELMQLEPELIFSKSKYKPKK